MRNIKQSTLPAMFSLPPSALISKLSININTINLIQKPNDEWQLKTINSTKLEMRNDIAARSEFLNLKRI